MSGVVVLVVLGVVILVVVVVILEAVVVVSGVVMNCVKRGSQQRGSGFQFSNFSPQQVQSGRDRPLQGGGALFRGHRTYWMICTEPLPSGRGFSPGHKFFFADASQARSRRRLRYKSGEVRSRKYTVVLSKAWKWMNEKRQLTDRRLNEPDYMYWFRCCDEQ